MHLRLDLLAPVVDDLELVGLELQEHGAEPGLPGDLELDGAPWPVPASKSRISADLLELDAERPGVLDRRRRYRPAMPGLRPIEPSPV